MTDEGTHPKATQDFLVKSLISHPNCTEVYLEAPKQSGLGELRLFTDNKDLVHVLGHYKGRIRVTVENLDIIDLSDLDND